MADFCTNCARDMGFPSPDIDIKTLALAQKPGYVITCLCEGCGLRAVGQNAEGEIIVINSQGYPEIWDEAKDRMEEERQRAPDVEQIDGITVVHGGAFHVPGIVSPISRYEITDIGPGIRVPDKRPKNPPVGAMYEEPHAFRVWSGKEWHVIPKAPLLNKMYDTLAKLKADERMYYPTANVFSNAPLALIQTGMSAQINLLEGLLGLPLSKFTLTESNNDDLSDQG